MGLFTINCSFEYKVGNCEMLNIQCEAESSNYKFCIEDLSFSPSQVRLGRNFVSFGRLLERLGSQLDLSWSHLKASRATLGVSWNVLGWLQVDNMIFGVKIHDFGHRFGVQDR